tara:strand:+ start:709 stop:2670 length:1962 start_codon:yes stop_codon:yes gene_type:complete
MNNNEEKFNIAKQLHYSGRIKEAQKIYIKLLKIYNNNHILYHLVGTTYLQLKEQKPAIEYFKLSLKYNPNFPDTYNNMGIALAENKEHIEALNNYNKAIELKNDYIDAYLNRGISFNKLKKYDEAIKDFKFVINAEPNNAKAFNNLGNVFKELKKYDQAINFYEEAIKINNNFLEAISNKADVFDAQKKFKESLIELNKIYKIKPNFSGITQKIISNKMSIFDWQDYENLKEIVKDKLLNEGITLDPLFLYYLFDDLNIQLNNSKNFINNEFKDYNKIKYKYKRKKNNKIKIGYFSGDFHNHPVLHIMSDIFKQHDKNKFDIYAFSHGPLKLKNIWKKSIINYFNKFYEISNWSDKEIIEKANEEQIDIAVDLTGLTKYSRTSLFFNRVAPIQVNYLGYPGTSGLNSMDYILADHNVIKKHETKYFTEEVCFFPKCYIPSSNDITLKNSKKSYTRSEFSLPENETVFCAFHNPHKINPQIFSIWINILKRTGKSVLWVKSNDLNAKKNLQNEIKKRGVNKERIIFAEGIENINDHLERLKLADIFLDTFPYNSHSTVYDYLRANLPMVIMEGNSFPSRVGSSIYSSLELSELVAKNYNEYEDIAVNLSKNKEKLLSFKNKIKTLVNEHYLFNSKKFTSDLEDLYTKLYQKKRI